MRKRCILTTVVILLAIFGLSSSLWAEFDSNRSEDVLVLIEKGLKDKEGQRYVHALRKYKEAMTIIDDGLAKEPGDMRALLLKELLENKIKECKSVISKIEQEIDSSLPYKNQLKEAYVLIERADKDKNEGKLYVALKGYNEAEKKIKSALENIPEWQEAELLLELSERRILSLNEEIAGPEGRDDQKKAFSKNIEKIMRAVEKASIDEKDGRYLIALQAYLRALKMLEGLEKDYPQKAARISLTKEMVNIKVDGCRKKIEKIEKDIKDIVIEKEAERKPVRKKERIRPVPKKVKIRPVELPEEEGVVTEVKDQARVEVFVVEKPEPELKEPQPKPLFRGIRNFVTESRKAGREEALKANLANRKRLAKMRDWFKNAWRAIRAAGMRIKPPLVMKKGKTAVIEKEAVEEAIKEAAKEPIKGPFVYSLEGYNFVEDVKVMLDDEEIEVKKILGKGDDIWLNIEELAKVLGATLIHKKKEKFVILRTDSLPLGFEIGKKETTFKMNPFYELTRPIFLFEDKPYAGFDALGVLFNIDADWQPSDRLLVLKSFYKRESASFTTFTKPKPRELIEKEKKMQAAPVLKEEIFKEKRLIPFTPRELLSDIKLRINSAMSYFHNNNPNSKTRTRNKMFSMAGKIYDYMVDSRFEWRDEPGGHLVNKSKFIGLYRENTWLKFLDLYKDLYPLRSQSEGYEGFEITQFYKPFASRIWGGWKNITVSGPADIGSVKYYGSIGGIEQNYKSDLLDLNGEIIAMANRAETREKRGRTDFPRQNLVYSTDGRIHLPANFDLSGQYAFCNYNPDNQKDELIQDANWRIEAVWDRLREKEKFFIKGDYEFAGTDYASLGIPSTYQDYKGWSLYSRYKPIKPLSLRANYKQYQNNVDDMDSEPTTERKYFASSASYFFPTNTSLSLGWNRSYSETTGPGAEYMELESSLSNSRRIDITQNWEDLSLYLSYERYTLDARGSDTDTWSDTYSASVYKFLPQHRGSFMRLRHELKKSWYMASGNSTAITNNTDFGWRYYFTRDLYMYNDWYLRLTETRAYADTAFISTKAGAYWKLDKDLAVGLDFNFNERDLNHGTEKDWNEWSILFRCNYGFEYESPAKWAKIRGYVFRDLNANGIRDKGEEGIKNALILIPDEFMARTDKKGCYKMSEVTPGFKIVKLDTKTLPMELSVLYDNIVEVDAEKRQTREADFPLVMLNSLYGRVFIDENENSVHDIGEDGLEDIDIILSPDGRLARTDENGRFSFEFLKPGEYELVINAEKIPFRYKLASDEKIKVSPQQGEEVKGLNFVVRSKPVVEKVF